MVLPEAKIRSHNVFTIHFPHAREQDAYFRVRFKDRKQKQATGSTSPVELLGDKAEDDLDLW